MTRSHFFPEIGPFGVNDHPFAPFQHPDGRQKVAPALYRLLPVQGNAPQGLEQPIRKPGFEQLMLGDKIELPGYGKPGKRNILPPLMLGQKNKGAVPGQIPQPAYLEPEKREKERFQDKFC